MKKSNIFKGLAAVALTLAVSSCKSDYLDLQPVSQENSETITDNVFKMRTAAYGMSQSMYRQWNSLYDYAWFNGEPWYRTWFGESMGQDANLYFCAYYSGDAFPLWQHMETDNTWGGAIAWIYPYTLISQANYLIAGEKALEEKGELEGETAFRMAQAYTVRAHAYSRLHQLFGPRWEDSNNGEVHSVIIRTEAPDAEKPTAKDVSSTNDVLKLIYDDLDRAIELYDISEYDRLYKWEMNKSVAYGIYARAALLKNDYPNAEKYAHLASEGYDVMSSAEYTAGFNAENGEWMLSTKGEYTGIYYASFNAAFGCNGAYPCIWGNYGAGAIDYILYKQVYNSKDIRCTLFFTPDKVPFSNRGKFWNPEDCSGESMNINQGDNFPSRIQAYCDKMYEQTGKAARWKFPYSEDYLADGEEVGATYFPFGAQFKFWGTDTYSSGQVCLMRASEMLLIEAEAAIWNGNNSVAQDCLYKVNSQRITGYTKSTKTGDDLLDEVKLYRRFELWGEGFSWFDFKRWNEPIVRVAWESGNAQSGNWNPSYAYDFPVNYNNNWVWPIPTSETDYNDGVSSTVNNIAPVQQKKSLFY